MTRIEMIQHEVADYFEVKFQELKGLRRNRWYARPRMIAMYLARKLTHASYPVIGKWFGGRHHSTVIHAVRKIERLYDVKDSPTRNVVITIESRLIEGAITRVQQGALEPA